MSNLLTNDEQRIAMRRQGIPDHLIERYLAGRAGDQSTAVAPVYDATPERKVIAWPLRFTLPWSALVSDNDRYRVDCGRLHLTTQYRAARKAIRNAAKAAVGDAAPVAYPVQLTARVWVPDEMRAHDTANFAKAAHDSMQGVVVVNDRWFWKTTWEHVGTDCDAPRAEITIQPIPHAA